jgi:hypothetical protein
MNNRLIAALIAAALIGGASATSVRAWGCRAVASDGAYGYSYNWPSEQDAELTALNECDARSTSGDCSTESCDPAQ